LDVIENLGFRLGFLYVQLILDLPWDRRLWDRLRATNRYLSIGLHNDRKVTVDEYSMFHLDLILVILTDYTSHFTFCIFVDQHVRLYDTEEDGQIMDDNDRK